MIAQKGLWQNPQQPTVFIDFGAGKVYALPDNSDEVITFADLKELIQKLRPAVVVADNYPRSTLLQITEMATNKITFLKYKQLRKVAEARRLNGLKKSNKNDALIIRQLYYHSPEDFTCLFHLPEELPVRLELGIWRKTAAVVKLYKSDSTTPSKEVKDMLTTAKRVLKRLSIKIHIMALSLPLYRLASEELGLKGPTLAYIISYDYQDFIKLGRDKLYRKYQLTHGKKKYRTFKSQLLYMIANNAVLNKNPRYIATYVRLNKKYRDQGRRNARNMAVWGVAQKIVEDLRRIARKIEQMQLAQ
jgi:hypothetical protein